jgi:nicotinate-nucleotide adenylyltransferase
MSIEKIGILGGTFDPIHRGHIELALAAKDQLSLDRVIFMPTHDSYQKSVGTPPRHRLRMVELAIQNLPGFEVSTLEIERGGPSYSIETLEQLRIQHPSAELFFILGSDAYRGISSWHRSNELQNLAKFVIYPRNLLTGDPTPDEASAILLRRPQIDVSSTEIRKKIAKGSFPNSDLTPEVVQYIEEQNLYSGESK